MNKLAILAPEVEPAVRDECFDFKEIPASSGIYGIHPYPAMFHFLVVREIINNFSKKGNLVLGPFMGSGVVAGECLIAGRDFVGYDINPLAVLISKVRTTPLPCKTLLDALENVSADFSRKKPSRIDFHNIDYWFEEETIKSLSRLKQAIFAVKESKIRDFFKVAFSETVRRVSNTRYNEFKLFRRTDDNHSDALKTFRETPLKNIGLLSEFYRLSSQTLVRLNLNEGNFLDGVLLDDNSVDLILTSPPYGDSRTTVAYGQFSRLSLQWLDWEENVDRTSLGARPKDIVYDLPSKILYDFLERSAVIDEKRAKEVFSFYQDLFAAAELAAEKVRKNGFVCFAVGNRRVKGFELPTDKIVADFFAHPGLRHQKTIVRLISNKRMPAENSPLNVCGDQDSTMRYEYIVVLKKEGETKLKSQIAEQNRRKQTGEPWIKPYDNI
ncbi:MAG: DNA methyltransferase [Candidatus Omnitrophota bacterium]